MKFLLDVHIAGRSVGKALRAQGHDILALDEREDLRVLDDGEVLSLAAQQGRIVITRNIRDFAELARQWSEDGREHAGCICIAASVAGIGSMVRAVEAAVESQPSQHDWRGLFVIVGAKLDGG